MKKYTKLFAILLSALLVVAIFIPFVSAENELLDGQKELYIKNVTVPPVQDGILNGHELDGTAVDEYGSNGPTFCLTPEDYRAVDLEGNPLDVDLPSYIYLYMAKDADALYLGMEIQEAAHSSHNYEFTTFLGFGDKNDADTMNSGSTTTFKAETATAPSTTIGELNDWSEWLNTQVTALSAQKVAADGTVTDTTANRKFSVPLEYTLPAWTSETKNGETPVTIFEAELDFEDAMLGSGLSADADVPEYAFFAFDLGVFDGADKIGKIVFNNDLTGKDGEPDGEIKTVPHVLNLKTEFNATNANNANLSALSVEGGKLSPAFDTNITEYTLTLPNGTDSANVTATAEADETRVTVKGADNLDSIGYGGNKTITVTCVAQSSYEKTYTLNVEWAYDNTDYYVDSANGDDSTGDGTEDAPYKTIEKALTTIAAEEWEVSEMATIHINGTFNATATKNVLFDAKTVFTKGATRLPITIKGGSQAGAVIHAEAKRIACANSYHFDTLTFAIDEDGTYLYAGSGQVRFDNVKWTTKNAVSRTNSVFFADTFTAKVFEGWTATEIAKAKSQNKNGNIDTSITIGNNADYWINGSAYYYLVAIGDNNGWADTSGIQVQSTDVEVSAIIDGSKVSRFCIYSSADEATTNKYAKANLFMYGSNSSVHFAGIDKGRNNGRIVVDAEVEIGIFGGQGIATSSTISGGRNDTVNGDFTITVESGNWDYVQGGHLEMKINGNYECNFGGAASTTSFYGYCGSPSSTNAISGTVVHNIYGGAITNYYGIFGSPTISNTNIVHNISGGTIVNYYGAGNSSAKVTTAVENNISGGTFSGNFYGAGGGAANMQIANVINNISGGTFATYYGTYKSVTDTVFNNISGDANFTVNFRGAELGTSSIVKNDISGGTFNATYNGTYDSNTKETYTTVTGGNFKKAFYVTYLAKKSSDLVKTTISGGTFGDNCLLGGYGGNITKTEINISGGTFNGSNTVYMGPGSANWPSVVGNIENTVTGGTFQKAVYGGGESTLVTGNIVNNIEGGNFGSFYSGIKGSYSGNNMIDSANANKGVEGKIINTFGKVGEAGPTFSANCFGGNLASIENVTPLVVENNYNSGTWNSTVYGGSQNNTETVSSITNNVYGGTFNKFFTAGSYNSTTATVTNNISGGTFNGYFFGGSKNANITGDVVNDIKGGTFNSLFFGGSDHDTSSANDTTAPITYTIGGSIKNTFTGGTFKTGASGAGFGTIKGNVENTIKGNPDFQLGFYGVQATLMDTVVEGNVLNLITKDENGVAPTFPVKNQAIEYVYENADHTYVYSTNGSNISFAATGASGTVYTDGTKTTTVYKSSFTKILGYVETIVEAGTFNGHYYLGGGVNITGKNDDGYAALNIVNGDPVFNNVWAGGCINPTTVEWTGILYNEINGGTFNSQFSSYNRQANNTSNNITVETVIKDGTFNDIVEFARPWSGNQCSQHKRTAPYTMTIEGGTFNKDVYGLAYFDDNTVVGSYLAEGGSVTINVNGGTFAKNIYAAGSPYTANSFAGEAVINIEPTKGDVTILGTVARRFDKEKVNLKGGEYKLILGADASVEATSATGDVKIGQNGAWKKHVYVTMPEGNDAVVTVTGTHTFDRIGNSVVAVKGGVKLYGATMILTDRVAVRALFDKASVDAIDNFTFSFTLNGNVLAEGSKSALTIWEENQNYYCIVLAKIGANDFTTDVIFSGSDLVWETEFSIKDLAKMAEGAWAGNEEGVALAKAMQNFATIVADPNAELDHNLEPEEVVYTPTAPPSRDADTNFKVTGKGLIMSNAVGIRIYGTSETDINGTLTIKVNGTDVTEKAVIGQGTNPGEYTVDLYINAKNMSSELNIVITEKDTGKVCLNLYDRVDAIADSYPEDHDNYAKAQQLLVYIQAAVAYATKA